MNPEFIIQVEKLEKMGINLQNVIQSFEVQKSLNLDLKEYLKVQIDENKNAIHFETLDNISITVDGIDSDGSPNKVEPPEK